MLDQVLQRRLPLAVCTIYEARFPEPATRRLAATALTTLNDAITREAFARNVDCIDLRVLCDPLFNVRFCPARLTKIKKSRFK